MCVAALCWVFRWRVQLVSATCVSVCHSLVGASKWRACVWVGVSASCTSVESHGDQTVSQLPWEGSSGCDRVDEAKYPGSNALLCLSHNEAASPGQDNAHRMFKQGEGSPPDWNPRHDRRIREGSLRPRTRFILHYCETSSWSSVCVCVCVFVRTCVCVSSLQGYSHHHSRCRHNLC